MKHILFLYPYNRRTIPIDVALNELIKKGHKVTLLTFSQHGDLHEVYEKLGCETYTHVVDHGSSLSYYRKHIRFVARFCKEKNIDVVFAHLQEAMLVSCIAQYLCNSRFVMFRHHCYYEYLKDNSGLKPNRNVLLGDKIVNRLSKKMIVPSAGVRNPMIQREGVKPSKVDIIRYVYNIGDMLGSVDKEQAKIIRNEYNCELLLIMVSRLIPYKQHYVTLPAIKELIDEGLDIKLMIMDDSGWEGKRIQQYIDDNNLGERVSMLGFRKNILDYFAASDVLVHPSLTEASCSATKEAGLLEKLVVVNSHVGDFDDYIFNESSGFSFNANDYNKKLKNTLRRVYKDKSIIDKLGQNLKKNVEQQFSISEDVIDKYLKLIE